jgi:hypothetical protein
VKLAATKSSLLLTACCAIVASRVGHAQARADSLARLHGEVVDTALRPVPGVLVYLSTARTSSLSDDSGGFTLGDIEPGVDTLQLRGRGFMPRSFRLSVPDSVRGAIEIGTVKLTPGPPPSLDLIATVRDTLQRRPVAGAQVMVDDSVVGETDTTGAFAANAIPIAWGANTVLVRRVGYAPLLRMFWVGEPKARRSLTAVLQRQAFNLPEVIVEGRGVTLVYGRMREFWRRRSRGWGRFFTREDIERRHPVQLSDMLRMIPGIAVIRTESTTHVRSTRSSAGWAQGCELRIWIDGMQLSDADIDRMVSPEGVEAIEVYQGPETPVELGGALNSCGSVVIWTR